MGIAGALRRVIIVFIVMALAVLQSAYPSSAGADELWNLSRKQIDPEQWQISGTADLFFFTESESGLHFLSSEGQSQSLVSKRTFGNGLYRLRFHDFQSDNKEPGGRPRGSFLALGLGPGPRDGYVRVIRGTVNGGGYFEKNAITDSVFRKGIFTMAWVPTEAKYGGLELYYDGATVRAYFQSEGPDGRARWTETGSAVKPVWTSPPHLFIIGYPGPDKYCGTTRFIIDSIEYWPADGPLPAHEPSLSSARQQ